MHILKHARKVQDGEHVRHGDIPLYRYLCENKERNSMEKGLRAWLMILRYAEDKGWVRSSLPFVTITENGREVYKIRHLLYVWSTIPLIFYSLVFLATIYGIITVVSLIL